MEQVDNVHPRSRLTKDSEMSKCEYTQEQPSEHADDKLQRERKPERQNPDSSQITPVTSPQSEPSQGEPQQERSYKKI